MFTENWWCIVTFSKRHLLVCLFLYLFLMVISEVNFSSLLSSARRSLVGSNHHPEWAAGPDRVHLLRQDGDSDSEHHAVQEVHHRWTYLRYLSARCVAACFWPVWTVCLLVSYWYLTTSSVWGNKWQEMFTVRLNTLDQFCRKKMPLTKKKHPWVKINYLLFLLLLTFFSWSPQENQRQRRAWRWIEGG